MKVRRGEGLASHISPEPCVATCEGCGEASVGKMFKPAIVPRKVYSNRNADNEGLLEGNTSLCVIASAAPIPRGLRTWRVQKSAVREPGEVMADQLCWPASGKLVCCSR